MGNKQRSESAYWESIGADWEQLQPQRLWRLHSDAVNARLVESWLPRTGTGVLLKTDAFDEAVSRGLGPVLRARCEKLVAMDVALNTLRVARPNITPLVTSADARSLPFASGSIDAIVSLSTLDHFDTEEELLAALAELRRISAPGVRLLLTLDNPSNPMLRLRGALPFDLLHRIGLVPYFVGANLSPRRLVRALESLGFQIEERSAIIHVPRFAAIGVGGLFPRKAGARWSRAWLRQLMRFEGLGRLPTRFLTGHFIAIRATLPGG